MRFRITKAWSLNKAHSEGECASVACCCGTSASFIPTINADKSKAKRSPTRVDPTRTGRIRNQWIGEINRRWRSFVADVRELILVDDAFGLKIKGPFKLSTLAAGDRQRWRFVTDDEKVKQFRSWLDRRIDAGILSVDGQGAAWTNKYVDAAYKQGIRRGYDEVARRGLLDDEALPGFGDGQRSAFFRNSFAAPERLSKLRLLQTRTFEDLRGVTSQMSTRMARALADGLAEGRGALDIARSVSKAAGIPLVRARVIARTEIVYAHSEGQLDSMEDLGVDEVGVMAEWSTAGDDRVCPVCAALEGVVMSIKEARGLIPRHPNCRCTWLPANVGEDGKGQKRSKKSIADAVFRSLKREAPRDVRKRNDPAEIRRVSRWSGADVNFRGKGKPKPLLTEPPDE